MKFVGQVFKKIPTTVPTRLVLMLAQLTHSLPVVVNRRLHSLRDWRFRVNECNGDISTVTWKIDAPVYFSAVRVSACARHSSHAHQLASRLRSSAEGYRGQWFAHIRLSRSQAKCSQGRLGGCSSQRGTGDRFPYAILALCDQCGRDELLNAAE
jgi:hypothetical protein